MKVSKAERAIEAALKEAYRSLDVEVGNFRRHARAEGVLETVGTVEDLTKMVKRAGEAFYGTLWTIYERPMEPFLVQLGFGRDRFESSLHEQMHDRFTQFIEYCCTVTCDAARIMKQKHLCTRAAQDILDTLVPLSKKFQNRTSEADATYLLYQCSCQPNSAM